MSTNNVSPQVKPKKKPPTAEDGPGSGFKRTKRWVDFTFGYGDTVPPTAVGPVVPGGSSGAVGDLGKPGDWDETAPIARPDTPELEEGIPQEAVDNSLLGKVLNLLDNVTPDDMGGLVRGTSDQWLPDVPYVSDLYRNTAGAVLGAGLSVTEGGLDVLNWGSEQMNHLGSALVSWLPGGIQTLDWDQSHDVSFGQAFVASMGATAGRLERDEAEAGDWMMLPFSLISLGASQIDPDNIAQDKEFNVLNKEQLDKAFSDGAGMWATGGLDAAWLVAADPTILLGGASTIARTGAKFSKFGGLSNQALRKLEQVNRFSGALADDAAVIAELGIDGARTSGRLGSEGENLIAAMEGNASSLLDHIWAKGENAGRQKTIISFLANDTDVNNPQKAADIVSALAGHAPSWNKIRGYDSDLFDRLSFANGIDNMAPIPSPANDAVAMANGGIYPLSDDAIQYGDNLIKDAEEFLTIRQETPFDEFERTFGTQLDYADDAAKAADDAALRVTDDLPTDQIAGQLIKRGGARVSPKMVRAANAYRRGAATARFSTLKRPTSVDTSFSGRGHFVYDSIEKVAGSRPITAIRWVGQGTPNGIVYLKGGYGERGVKEVSNWLRKSPIDPDTSALLLNKFVNTKTESGKALVLQEMEREAVARISTKHDLTPDKAEKLFDLYNAKRNAELANARRTETTFAYDPDTGEAIKLPEFYAEIDAAVPMIDTKFFDKVVGQNKLAIGTSESLAALDVLNSVWKVSVLLRLGYTQRNITEGFLRSVAVIGLAATNPKALGTLPVNIYRYAGVKRGLRSARKTERELDIAWENLNAARQILSESVTKKGKVKKGKAEVFSDAQKAEAEQLKKIDELSDQILEAMRVVKEKNASRRKTGMSETQVAPGVYLPGAFQGTDGEIARLLSSADITTRNTIQGKAQRQIDELNANRAFDEIDPSKLDAKQMPMYRAEYATRINRRYISDVIGRMVLLNRPIGEIKDFLRTPYGKRVWDELQATGGAQPAWQDVDAYLAEVIKRLDYEVPPNSKLREMVVASINDPLKKGGQITGSEIAAVTRNQDLPIIPGTLAESGANTVFGWAKKGFNFSIDNSMKWLSSIPETNLLRHPFYDNIYRSRQKELYALAAGQGQDMGSAAVKAAINKSAHADALRATNDTLYTIQEISNAANTLRFISPFFPAWENSMRTWGRIVYNNPAVLGAGNILWNIPNNLGWVVDENGKQVPKSSFLKDENTFIIWPQPVADFVGKLYGPFEPGERFMTRQSGFNVVFPGSEWWFSGVGPMTMIPSALALRGKPEDQEIIKQAIGENIYRQIVPNGNPNSDLVDSILPSALRYVKKMWSGESSDGAYLTLKNTMIEDAYITAQIEGRPLTESDFKKLDEKVNKFWTWQISNTAIAFTQSSYLSPYKLQRDEWAKLVDDQSLPYEEKIKAFLARFDGDDSFLAVTRSGSSTPTQLKPNLKTWERIYKNPDMINQLNSVNPKLVGMFGNMGSFEDPFSYAVWGEYSGTYIDGKPIREQLRPREIARNNQIADGWREWNIYKDTAENRAIELGYSSLQVDAAKNLRDMLAKVESDLSAKYPAWGEEKEDYESNLGDFIIGARIIVQNADLVDEDTTVSKIKDYLELREVVSAKLATVKDDKARKAIKEMGYAIAFELRQTDIGFADFYDQYLAFDDFREI